jgi:hypothetical protein
MLVRTFGGSCWHSAWTNPDGSVYTLCDRDFTGKQLEHLVEGERARPVCAQCSRRSWIEFLHRLQGG